MNGRPLGKTPLAAAAVPCGELVVAVAQPRFVRAEARLTAAPGAPAESRGRLERADGVLDVVSRPAGATVTVDGAPAGTTPALVWVRARAAVTVAVTLDGYQPWSRKLVTRKGKLKVTAALRRAR